MERDRGSFTHSLTRFVTSLNLQQHAELIFIELSALKWVEIKQEIHRLIGVSLHVLLAANYVYCLRLRIVKVDWDFHLMQSFDFYFLAKQKKRNKKIVKDKSTFSIFQLFTVDCKANTYFLYRDERTKIEEDCANSNSLFLFGKWVQQVKFERLLWFLSQCSVRNILESCIHTRI